MYFRQEFWSIRQYSGFYKHSVETALFGGERMFLDMGYTAGSQAQVISLAPARPGQHPVNTDLVTSVARDCVLACVECGILAEIHSALANQFPTMLEEVIEFRRDHIGSVEVCVRELLYRKNQLRYQQYPVQPSPQYGLQTFPHPQVHPQVQHQVQHPALPTNGFPGGAVFHPGQAGPVFPPVFPGQTGGPGPQYVTVERLAGQLSHHSPAGSSTSTLRQGQIPTTILELSAQDQPQSQPQPQPQAPERRARSEREREREGGARPRENKTGKSRKSGAEQDFDSWDYVYKHLQQTGYNKDQAERPDVLERNSSQSEEELRRNIQGLRLRDSARNGESSQPRHHGGGEGGRRGRGREQSQSHRHSRVVVETSGSEVEQDNSRYSSAVSEETHQQHHHHQQHHQQPHRQHRYAGHIL